MTDVVGLTPSPLARWWERAASVSRDRRLVVTLVLAFACRLPLMLQAGTMSVRLHESGLSKTVISVFAVAGVMFTLRVLWAPIVDHMRIPLFTDRLGQRRGWILAMQLVVIAGVVGLGLTDPSASLTVFTMWVMVIITASATLDLALDAYRIELLDEREMGTGAAMSTIGMRLATLVAGGGALMLADTIGWTSAYFAIATLVATGIIANVLGPVPPTVPEKVHGYREWMSVAVLAPIADFMKRRGWLLILAFVLLYKYADGLIDVMSNPFFLETGFTKTDIGLIGNTYGIGLTIAGSIAGAVLVARVGVMRTLMAAGLVQIVATLLYVLLAMIGRSIPMLMATISLDSIVNGIAGVAAVTYMSLLCNRAHTATQYALLSALVSSTKTVLVSGAGWIADQFGWVTYFLVAGAAGIPCIVLLLILMHQQRAASAR